MPFLFLLLISSLPIQDVPQQPTTAPASSPSLEGPMRTEMIAVFETRYWFADETPERLRPPELRLRLRVAGERLNEVVRISQEPVFTEFVDDTGASLLSTEPPNTTMRAVTPRDAMVQQGLLLTSAVQPSTRGAKTIQRIRGSVAVVYAKETESITLHDPAQFRGKTIDDPRLKELGVEIQMLAEGNPAALPPGGRFVAYQITKNANNVRDIGFYDAWLKRMRSIPREMPANDGTTCTVVQLDQELGPDHQLVIEVFPKIEEASVPISFDDVKLP